MTKCNVNVNNIYHDNVFNIIVFQLQFVVEI